jgi:HAD superfamily hydrolase (TIGR01509 family)
MGTSALQHLRDFAPRISSIRHAIIQGQAPKVALLFDCDGVIVETEELHRLAYNGAFEAFGLKIDGTPVTWDTMYYDKLQNTVGGGKPKMRWHFTTTMGGRWPDVTAGSFVMTAPQDEDSRGALIDALQEKKTEIYTTIVDKAATARPGVLALMDEAIAAEGVAVGICSAATRAGFEKVVNSVVGEARLAKLDVIIAGDDVERKKPDPEIYNTARARLGLPASQCVVIEDSLVGLRAAVGAGMRCVVTYTASTAGEDFYVEGASAKLLDLSQRGGVNLRDLFGSDLVLSETSELLLAQRDPRL